MKKIKEFKNTTNRNEKSAKNKESAKNKGLSNMLLRGAYLALILGLILAPLPKASLPFFVPEAYGATVAEAVADNGVTASTTLPPDVPGHAGEKAIGLLIQEGIITGDSDGYFHPDQSLTRAQASTILVKALNPPAAAVNGTATETPALPTFPDLGGYGWAYGYIGYAASKGIVEGYPGGSFRPGAPVTYGEMVTMTLRAAGISKSEVTGEWPYNYLNKAAELNLLDNLESPENPARAAAKWEMAQLTANSLNLIEEATALTAAQDKAAREAAANEKPSFMSPNSRSMVFKTAAFNAAMTTFDGKPLSPKVAIYTTGKKAEYSKSMSLPSSERDYETARLYKYKNVSTPAWYAVEEGRITRMVLPSDVGFSGKAYGMLNGSTKVIDRPPTGESRTPAVLNTLIAGQEMLFLAESNQAQDPSGSQAQLPAFDKGLGNVYEFTLLNGRVQATCTAAQELSPGKWSRVLSYAGGQLKLSDSSVTVKPEATLYMWDDLQKKYEQGTLRSINPGKQVRIYDISPDDETSGDIVVVRAVDE